MQSDGPRDRLEEQRRFLEDVKATFDHLGEESETEAAGELATLVQHPADLGTETFDRERDLSLLEQVVAELDDVEHALRRLDDGSYGTCEACGQPIDAARLEALPAARFCVKDQSAAEREAGVHPPLP
jgi:RNA polymerase-binding transcription factor DksA